MTSRLTILAVLPAMLLGACEGTLAPDKSDVLNRCLDVVCAALDQCHAPGVCDANSGICSNPLKPNGSPCDDGDNCTVTDSCQSGVCTPGARMTCAALDQCHTAGTCDPTSGVCSNPVRADNTPCDDGNKCALAESCQSGVCVVKASVTCFAIDQCHVAGTCDPTSGACSNPARADDTPCDDGSKCTLADACQSGLCLGAPVTCAASDQCHVGLCDPATGACSNPKKPEQAPCDDANQCTEADSCHAGVCRGRPVCVLSYHNDDASTGLHPNENVLAPENVTASTFGRLYSVPLDGQVYAQPLYVANVNVTVGANKGLHDVVYVATQHDSLYAVDAASGTILWQVSFLDPGRGITSVPGTDVAPSGFIIEPEIGVTATPVIDLETSALYITAKTREVLNNDAANPHYVYRIHAVDLGSGSYTSTTIADTTCIGFTDHSPDASTCASYTYNNGPFTIGTGDGFVTEDGVPKVYFNAMRQLIRPAMALVNGVIIVAAGSNADLRPYHGWLLAYDRRLSLVGAFNTTPNTWGGAIWQSGGKVAVDPAGFIYVMTGNGVADAAIDTNGFPASGDYTEAFLKLAMDAMSSPTQQTLNGWGFRVVDFFMPSNRDELDANDADLGSGAPLVLPDGIGPMGHPNLLIGAGKEGRIYVLDRDDLGHFVAASPDATVQELSPDGLGSGVFNTPSYFDDGVTKRVFIVPRRGNALAFEFSNGILASVPLSQSVDLFAYPGPPTSLSCSSDRSSALIWVLARGANQLRAYDPTDLSRTLYTSSDAPSGRDELDTIGNFTVPTVVGGRVFVGTLGSLVAYGLLAGP